ncbi:hypothetical protein [Lacrimispora indolis]|uniref:hypothetical protein n=1 Tax=Lacrimispora indolis TaxID=69825 RepID=UPI000429DC6E|nr:MULTISPECIES: hypothetical protein [Lachnospiraceae]MBE7722526.1 hypothetical protein [Lacrimispora celerecrescens]
MNVSTVLIIAAFIIIVALMVTDKINAVAALPLMAVVLCLIVRIPVKTIMNDVVGGGISGLSGAIFSTLIAAVLGEVIRKTGIAEKLIRSAAEMGGDNPYFMAILCFLACGFCFIGLSGVGAKIMLGLIVFPIMLSVGVPKVIAAFVMLAGTSIGYFMNVARWTFIGNLVGLEASDPLVKNTAIMLIIPGIIISILLIVIGIKVKGPVFSWSAEKKSVSANDSDVPLYAVLAPVIPLVLVMAFKWDVNTALIAGIIYAVLCTQWKVGFKGSLDLINKAAFDGFANVSVTIVIMMGIGMVLAAAKQELLLAPIQALLTKVVPTSPLMIILVFGAIGPFLTMYRGPLNPWGLGAALIGILLGTGLPIGLIVTLAWLYDYYVAVNDPTASQVTWACGYMQLGVGKYTRGTFLIDALFVLAGVILAVVFFM